MLIPRARLVNPHNTGLFRHRRNIFGKLVLQKQVARYSIVRPHVPKTDENKVCHWEDANIEDLLSCDNPVLTKLIVE